VNTYLATAVGGVAVLFGFGLWSAFTTGVRRGRAVERARADRRRGPVRLSEDLAEVVAEQEHDGLRTRLRLGGLDARVDAGLPPKHRDALREATGEALRNTARHSGVHEAEVTVRTRDGGVAVTTHDAGSGFDMDSCRLGFGIGESIVARMTEVGGSATIQSRPGAGTRVTLWVPV
jgi:signal transduction histidine kinase